MSTSGGLNASIDVISRGSPFTFCLVVVIFLVLAVVAYIHDKRTEKNDVVVDKENAVENDEVK